MLHKPIPLNKTMDLSEFNCGKFDLDLWFIKYAKQAQSSGSANTFVVCDNNIPVGYYSLTVGQVDRSEAPLRIAKGMGGYPIPVIILARLAVSNNYQGKSIGSNMLKDAIQRSLVVSIEVGIRAILTHPIDENAEKFYKHFGFEESPLRDRQLLLLLKDAKRILT